MLLMSGSHVRVAAELRAANTTTTTTTTTSTTAALSKRNAAALSKETGMHFVAASSICAGGVEIVVADAQVLARQSRICSEAGVNREWHIHNRLFPVRSLDIIAAAAASSLVGCDDEDVIKSLLLDGGTTTTITRETAFAHDQETSSILSSITVPVSQFTFFSSTFPSPQVSSSSGSTPRAIDASSGPELTQAQRQQRVSNAAWYLGDGYIADPLHSNPNYRDIMQYVQESQQNRKYQFGPPLPVFDMRQFVQVHKPNRLFFEFSCASAFEEEAETKRMIKASVNGVRQLLRQYGVFTCDLEHHDHHSSACTGSCGGGCGGGTVRQVIAVYRVSATHSWRVHVPFASVPDLRTFAILHDILLEILLHANSSSNSHYLWHRWLRFEPAMYMHSVPVVFNTEMRVCEGCRAKTLGSAGGGAGSLFSRCVAVDDMNRLQNQHSSNFALTRDMLVACMGKTHTQFNAESGVCAAIMFNSENVCDVCKNGSMMQTTHFNDNRSRTVISTHNYAIDDNDYDDDVIDLNDSDLSQDEDDGECGKILMDLFDIHVPPMAVMCVTCYRFGDWKHAFHHHSVRDNALRTFGTISRSSSSSSPTPQPQSPSTIRSFVPVRNILTARTVEFGTFFMHDVFQMVRHRLKQMCRDASTVCGPHVGMMTPYATQVDILDKLNGHSETYIRDQIGLIHEVMNVDAASSTTSKVHMQQQHYPSSKKRNASGNQCKNAVETHTAVSSTVFELDCSGDDNVLFQHIDAMKRDIISVSAAAAAAASTSATAEDEEDTRGALQWISFARMAITAVTCTSKATTSTHKIVSMCMALSSRCPRTKSTTTMVITSKCSTPPSSSPSSSHVECHVEDDDILPTTITITAAPPQPPPPPVHKVPVRRGRQQQVQQQQQAPPPPPPPPLKFTHTCSITSIVSTTAASSSSPRASNFAYIGHGGCGDRGSGLVIIPDLLLYVLSKGTSNMDIIETLRSAAHDARHMHENDLALFKRNRDLSLRMQMQQQQQQQLHQHSSSSSGTGEDEEMMIALVKRKKLSIAKINNALY
jgi:hypothetical protein